MVSLSSLIGKVFAYLEAKYVGDKIPNEDFELFVEHPYVTSFRKPLLLSTGVLRKSAFMMFFLCGRC